MPFSFLNPLLLAGVLGAAVPVLVHLLGRRQATRRPFPALAFLLQSERRLAARRRVRHLLLLLMRATLIAAVAVALARPLGVGAIAGGSGQPVSAVVVLDASASMAARSGDGSAFDRARELLRAELERLPAGSEVLVLSAAGPRAAERLSPGFVGVRESLQLLERAEVSFETVALPALAGDIRASLEGAHRAEHLVLIASDLQGSSWQGGADDAKLGAPALVLDAGRDGDDVAILSAAVAGDDERAVTLQIAADPARPAGDVAIRLETGGHPSTELRTGLVNRGMVKLSEAVGTGVLAIPDGVAQGAELRAVIEPGGALTVNDGAYLWLPSPRRVRVLIADGAPHPSPWSDEIFYLERALATEPRLAVRVVDASQAHLPDLTEVDVVILADAGRLDASSMRQLLKRTEEGLGVLYTVGAKTNPSELQATLGRLLPGRPRGLQSRRTGEPPVRLTLADPLHPVLRPFDSSASAETLRSVNVSRFLSFEAEPEARVILDLSQGGPALVEGRRAEGKVAILTTSIDRDFADLAVRPAFVPLLTRLTLHLAGRLDDDGRHGFTVGEAPTFAISLASAPPRWDAPDGSEVAVSDKGDGRVELSRSERPGLYRSYIAGRRSPAFDYVVNVASAESDFIRISPEQALAALGQTDGVGFAAGAVARRSQESSLSILWVIVIAFLGEALLGQREGRGASGERT